MLWTHTHTHTQGRSTPTSSEKRVGNFRTLWGRHAFRPLAKKKGGGGGGGTQGSVYFTDRDHIIGHGQVLPTKSADTYKDTYKGHI